MRQDRQLEELKQEYMNRKIPTEGLLKLKEGIDRAKLEKKRRARRHLREGFTVTAAACLLAVALPNMNAGLAHAMGQLPLLGGFFKAVTFREYQYTDEKKDADMRIPHVTVEQTVERTESEQQAGTEKLQEAADTVNFDIDQATQELIRRFESEAEVYPEAHQALYVDYETATDSDRWFTLKLYVEEIAASGYEHNVFYTIDKLTGEVVSLKDLFTPESDYVEVLSAEIIRQMREQMAASEDISYFLDDEDFPEDDFKQISEEQDFYFNEEGDLVIAFDEYEVAPGYMGAVEFVIGQDITDSMMR